MSRHFDDLDAVLEFDALDDFRPLIFALQAPPRFRGDVDEFEHHELGGVIGFSQPPCPVAHDNELCGRLGDEVDQAALHGWGLSSPGLYIDYQQQV